MSRALYVADTASYHQADRGDSAAARATLQAVLARPSSVLSLYDSAAYARLYARAAFLHADTAGAVRYYDAARPFLHLLRDTVRADVLRAFGTQARANGDTPSARAYYAEAYILARSLRDSSRAACADSLMLVVGPGEIGAPGASQGVQNGRMPLVTLLMLLVLSWVWFWLEHIKSQIARRAPLSKRPK